VLDATAAIHLLGAAVVDPADPGHDHPIRFYQVLQQALIGKGRRRPVKGQRQYIISSTTWRNSG
jgi:hypothetical protein